MPIGHRDGKCKSQELSPDQLVAKPELMLLQPLLHELSFWSVASQGLCLWIPPPGAVGWALLPNVMEAKSALLDSWLQTSPQGGGRFGEISNQRACESWWVREAREAEGGGYPEKVRGVGSVEELRRDYASHLCSGDFGPGPTLSTLCMITYLTLTKTFATHTIIIPILQSRKLRLREMKYLAQSHPTRSGLARN